MLKIIYFITFLVICTIKISTPNEPQVNLLDPHRRLNTAIVEPAIKRYVSMYIKAKGDKLSQAIDIRFDDLIQYRLGECNIYGNGYKIIKIDTKKWILLDEMGRKSLIFHELAHCDLGIMHDDIVNNKGKPRSIMNSYAFKINNKEWNSYVNELFSKQK